MQILYAYNFSWRRSEHTVCKNSTTYLTGKTCIGTLNHSLDQPFRQYFHVTSIPNWPLPSWREGWYPINKLFDKMPVKNLFCFSGKKTLLFKLLLLTASCLKHQKWHDIPKEVSERLYVARSISGPYFKLLHLRIQAKDVTLWDGRLFLKELAPCIVLMVLLFDIKFWDI